MTRSGIFRQALYVMFLEEESKDSEPHLLKIIISGGYIEAPAYTISKPQERKALGMLEHSSGPILCVAADIPCCFLEQSM